jgi:hypothetical protein
MTGTNRGLRRPGRPLMAQSGQSPCPLLCQLAGVKQKWDRAACGWNLRITAFTATTDRLVPSGTASPLLSRQCVLFLAARDDAQCVRRQRALKHERLGGRRR